MSRRRPSPSPGVLAALVLAVAAAGCAVKVAPRHAWTLSQRTPVPQSLPGGPAVAVRRFTAAEEVRTTSLTWRRSGGRELVRYPDESWADYPDRLLEEIVVAALDASGRFSAVAASPPHGDVDGILACRLIDFSEWDEGGARVARVAVRWTVTRPDGTILDSGVEEEAQPVSGTGAAAAVEAFARSAEAVAGRLVEDAAAAIAQADEEG